MKFYFCLAKFVVNGEGTLFDVTICSPSFALNVNFVPCCEINTIVFTFLPYFPDSICSDFEKNNMFPFDTRICSPYHEANGCCVKEQNVPYKNELIVSLIKNTLWTFWLHIEYFLNTRSLRFLIY